jgi:SAM-dependent methyltransferase
MTATAEPLAFFGAALRRAAAGDGAGLRLVDPTGTRAPLDLAPAEWCGGLRPGDGSMLDRCHGATLDVGCGPGRLTAALARAGRPALGIDVSAEAVRQTRDRGGRARRACVLTSDLRPAAWRHALLADGNIGIGGDPVRLVARCRDLLGPGGDLIAELAAPGARSWSGRVAMEYGDTRSDPFRWAVVSAGDIGRLAARASMTVAETWTEAGRWFARLTHA